LGRTEPPQPEPLHAPRPAESDAAPAPGLHFEPLPGTRAEGIAVARLLGVRPWFGAEVRKGRLADLPSPRVLHLATPGFFLGDPPARRPAGGWDDPLLRGGLALAGANTCGRPEGAPAQAGDGLLTAREVSGLDLLETELVVLSACETAPGGGASAALVA